MVSMIVGMYIRVSTAEQAEEGYSISAQEEKLEAYCKAQGWTNYKTYIDDGISGKSTQRPKLQLLMNDIKQGKINMILVYRLDRFTRSVRDLHNLLDYLETYNCKFRSATEMYDTSTAMGRMFIGLVALMAEWETANMSERIKLALDKRVAGGERGGGNIPFGFDVMEGVLVKNDQGKILMGILDKIEKGWSASKVADYIQSIDTTRSWTHHAIIRIVRNPNLYGATRWKEKLFENTHESYITKEHFDKLQKILNDHAKSPRKNVDSIYLFQGVLICPSCGNPMSVNRFFYKAKSEGIVKEGVTYRCKPCEKVGNDVPGLNELKYTDALIDYMKKLNFDEITPPAVEEDNELIVLEKELDKIQRQRNKYQRAWSTDLMTDDEFELRMNETKTTYEDLLRRISERKQTDSLDIEDLKDIVVSFRELFEHRLSQDERRDFIQQFIRKIEFDFVKHEPSKLSIKPKKGRSTVVIKNIEFY
ncbi:recombinase family protein [Psychrobacillus sp. FSL H8-0510]|uniref:recombinase family protein n=1 Tax=Psychrobacillus sp. FSL H8-0510 TaxID=2921394 RepID=UPI0030FC1EB6